MYDALDDEDCLLGMDGDGVDGDRRDGGGEPGHAGPVGGRGGGGRRAVARSLSFIQAANKGKQTVKGC